MEQFIIQGEINYTVLLLTQGDIDNPLKQKKEPIPSSSSNLVEFQSWTFSSSSSTP